MIDTQKNRARVLAAWWVIMMTWAVLNVYIYEQEGIIFLSVFEIATSPIIATIWILLSSVLFFIFGLMAYQDLLFSSRKSDFAK